MTRRKLMRYEDLGTTRMPAEPPVVFTTGVFDLLHPGHVEHLEACRKWGEVLVVSVGNDATVRALKGPERPVMPAAARARVVAALACVDYVLVSEEQGRLDHVDLLRRLKPRVYVICEDDPAEAEKFALAKEMGCAFVVLPRTPPQEMPAGVSTTQVIAEVREPRKRGRPPGSRNKA